MSPKAAKAAPDPCVCVISGKDAFLVAEECEALLNRLFTPDQRALALYQPPADEAVVADVFDELRTRPFLAPKRVVLIKDADDWVSANRQHIESYFDNPSPCGVLVLTVSTWHSNTRLAKKLPHIGQLLDVGEIKPWHLAQFATKWAQNRHGKQLTARTAELLVELAGDEPGRIAGEIEKLAVYVGDRKTISPDDINALIGHNRMFNAFAVLDSVAAGDLTTALKRLRQMFAADKNAEYTVVGAFAYHLRKMFAAKVALGQGNSPAQAGQKLGLRGNNDRFFRQVSGMSLERIAAVFCRLGEIDYLTKTGGVEGTVAIERLVIEMASGIRPGGVAGSRTALSRSH